MKQQKQQGGITVFFSYAQADQAVRDQLATHLSQLKRDGLIEEWSDQQILAGSDRAQAIDQALHFARIILLLISADFLASDACYQIEMQQALERHQREEACVVPIIVRPCDWRSSPFTHLQCLPRNGKPIALWNHLDEAFIDVVAGIRSIMENRSLSKASAPRAALPAIWNIPYPQNPFFMGRDEILSQMHVQLQADQPMILSQQPQAISGLGGIGKTQIAVEYAYRFGQEYQVVLWAQAESREALFSSYVAFAALLDLPEQNQEQTITVSAVKRWLQTHSKWLLILDNADELALVPEFLPPTLGGHLLLTTRAQAMGRLASRIEVEMFSVEQGALFLLRRAGLLADKTLLEQVASDDREQAVQITKALGGLPLALDQAGAYLEETGCSLSEYQQLYRQHRTVLLGERRGLVADHPAPVATTWSLSFQKVEEENPAAADLLRLCAFLQPDAIPEEIILEGGEPLGPHLSALATNPLAFHEVIGILRAYSLLQRSAEEHLLSLHRLVQAVLQDAMPEHDRDLWRERVLRGLNTVFPEVEAGTWRRCERLVPHVLLCAAEVSEQTESLELATVLGKAANHLRGRGQYQQAEPLYQRALRILEQARSLESPQMASLLNGLAFCNIYQGIYEQGEFLFQRAMRILGQEEPDHEVARALRGLGISYVTQGKYEQAKPLLQRAVHIWEQMPGREHYEVAFALNYLAVIYGNQSKYEQAESLYQRALAIVEQTRGPEHSDGAFLLYGMADLYQAQGEYEQAEQLHQRALCIREQALGPEHHYVTESLASLADLYFMQGKYEQAELLYQRLLHIWEQRLGETHPNMASDSNDITIYLRRGYIYLHLKKREEANIDFTRYALLQPGNVDAAWMAVYASLSKQRPGIEIAEHLEMIATLDPQSDEACICRGVALGLRGKPQEGLTELEQALRVNAYNEDAWFWKGMMCAYLGQSTVAMESIEQALHAGLPPILLTPLFWLERKSSQFYQEYAEPLLKQHGLR